MKNILFSFIFLLSATSSKCQNYQSIFGQDSTQWFILEEIIDGAQTRIYNAYDGIDSTMNGHVYMKVLNSSQTTGLIREDTTNGKTWYYSFWTQSEKIIMDLSLQLNDTFFIYPSWMDSIPAVVDSVFLINGKKHIRFDFPLYGFITKFEFIEGTGPNAGITYQGQTNGWSYISENLLCKYTDSTEVYSNLQFNGMCYVSLVGVNDISTKTRVIAYPNPVRRNECLNLEYTTDLIKSVHMFDIFGKELILLNRNQVLITQPSGIYFILVSYLSGKSERIKVTIID